MSEPSRSKIDDETLTARARDGDGIAFSALVERHYARVVVAAEAIAGSLPLAEICAQDAFARAGAARPARWPLFRALVYRTAIVRALVRRPLGQSRRKDTRARAVLVLREYGGFSYDEVAELLGLPPAGVRQLLSRARHEAGAPWARLAPPPAPSVWRQG